MTAGRCRRPPLPTPPELRANGLYPGIANQSYGFRAADGVIRRGAGGWLVNSRCSTTISGWTARQCQLGLVDSPRCRRPGDPTLPVPPNLEQRASSELPDEREYATAASRIRFLLVSKSPAGCRMPIAGYSVRGRALAWLSLARMCAKCEMCHSTATLCASGGVLTVEKEKPAERLHCLSAAPHH